MPHKRPTVRDAVIAFMTVFSTSPSPHERLATFIGNLGKDPRWSEEEIAEVQRLIKERMED